MINSLSRTLYYGVVAIFFLFIVSCSSSKNDNPNQSHTFNIIPKPVSINQGNGFFYLSSKISLKVNSTNDDISSIANHFSNKVKEICGFSVKIGTSTKAENNSVFLELLTEPNDAIGDEGYILDIKSSKVHVSANKPAGIFYGMQSLMQLVSASVGSDPCNEKLEAGVPCGYIMDYPRFEWRGLLFDAAHHFYEKEDVMRFIDQMAIYKYNILQLHLTNDNGWRIEIKSYPKLNEVGSWRVPRTGIWGKFELPQPGEKADHGGYYTQEELKELVKYAQDRYVTILPGIEMPGHCLALIASYPETSCTGLQYDVNPGSRKPKDIPYAICPGKESNFEMFDKILTEYAEIFPCEYIHIGGDEVNKDFWKKCPLCQKRMKEENLKSVEELQSYFIKRMVTVVESKGKKLIGWDEILQGGLAPRATVMSWRGMEGGIKAAQMKQDVVMSPTSHCYFDYRQTDPNILPEHSRGGLIRLSKTYEFEPVPANVDPQYILGGQGNVWSEYMPDIRQVEYMTWPRAMALAEVLWSPRQKREIDEFLSRVEVNFSQMDRDKIRYAKSIYDPIVTPVRNSDGRMEITISSEVKGLDVYYTFDGSIPDNYSTKYNHQPIEIPKGVTRLWAVTYRDGQRVGKYLSISINELERRL